MISKLKRLSKNDILEANDLQTDEVEVPEWGGVVLVRGLTGTERESWEESRIDRKKKPKKGGDSNIRMTHFRASLVARTVVDDNGNLIFSDSDVVKLGQKNGAALNRVFEKAHQLSGMSEADVEEMEEDLDEADSDDSSSS